MVNFCENSWLIALTNFFFLPTPLSENGISLINGVVSPTVNMYQGGIILKYKAAYFLALEAEAAANLIVIPTLEKSTVIFCAEQIYFGIAVLVVVIGLVILVSYGRRPPGDGGGSLLDSSVSSVSSTSCGSTVNIQAQSALPHSGIDISTGVSSDVVTTVLVDGGGSMLSTQSSIIQVLLAEPALTGIVDPALFEVGTPLVLASAAVLATSVLPEVAAATMPLVPLLETELGIMYCSLKNLTKEIIQNYLQYEYLKTNDAPSLTDTIKFLSNPHLNIIREELLRMGYDLSEYDGRFAILSDGALKKPLGDFIYKSLGVMLEQLTALFPSMDLTPSVYNTLIESVYDSVLNRIHNLNVAALNKFPCQSS